MKKIYNIFFWNELICHLPSRRIRRFFLTKFLKSFCNSASVLMHVKIMDFDNISIGSRSVINPGVILDGRKGSIFIGQDVDIATHSHIWTLEHNPSSDNHGTSHGDVVIEDNVWIASRVSILPGVRIGKGAVVAAGSVVTRDVPDKTIVGGIPAKKIGMRNSSLNYKLNFNIPLR